MGIPSLRHPHVGRLASLTMERKRERERERERESESFVCVRPSSKTKLSDVTPETPRYHSKIAKIIEMKAAGWITAPRETNGILHSFFEHASHLLLRTATSRRG